MGGGNGGSSTTSTKPWKGQRPYLQDLFGEAQGLYDAGAGQEFYPGQTVADFSGQTNTGMNMLYNQGMSGTPQQDALGGYITGALNQNQIDPRAIANHAFGAASGMPQGQNMMSAAGMPAGYGVAANRAGVGMSPDLSQVSQGMGYGDASQRAGVGMTPDLSQVSQGLDYGEASQRAGIGMSPDLSQVSGGADAMAAANQAGLGADAGLQSTAAGDFLGSNPYLDDVYNNAARNVSESFNEDIMPGLNATFGMGGRTGSGIHALSAGKAAGDAAGELSEMAGNIYAPAYEAERDRMLQAGGDWQQGDIARRGMMTDMTESGLDRILQSGDLWQQGDLTRRGMANDLTEGGLDRILQSGDLWQRGDIERRGMANDLTEGGLDRILQSGDLWQSGDIARRTLASNVNEGGMDRMLSAGQGLGQLGMSGINALNNSYGNVSNDMARAGSMVGDYRDMNYGDIDQIMRVGAMSEDQNQRNIDAERERFDFYQNAPFGALQNYAGIVNGAPSFSTSTQRGSSGSRLAGAAGGALAGGQMFASPWGAIGGGLMGLLG